MNEEKQGKKTQLCYSIKWYRPSLT